MTEVIRLHTPPVTELDRYSVVSRFERIAILRGLIEKRAMVTLSFGDESRFVLTTLLAINPEYEELVFETPRASGNGAAAPDPLAADIVETTGDSELDSVKVRFLSGRAERTTWQGQAAFRLRLPERMWRLQRREGFRIDGPVAYPVVCRCLLPDAIAHTHLRVTDISIGGVSLAIEAPLRLPQAGEQIRECHIELPGVGTVRGTLEVVHGLETESEDEAELKKRRLRVGCRFVDLPGPCVTLLQRYITQLERDRRHVAS